MRQSDTGSASIPAHPNRRGKRFRRRRSPLFCRSLPRLKSFGCVNAHGFRFLAGADAQGSVVTVGPEWFWHECRKDWKRVDKGDLVRHEGLERYGARYRKMSMEPFAVTLVLREGARLAGYDPLHLDNLLARCVVDRATQGRGLPNDPRPYDLPVPIQAVWRDARGCPLYASTVFQPVGWSVEDVTYWHKRIMAGEFSGVKSGKLSLNPQGGRYLEKRVPLPTRVCREWRAEGIGNAEEIADLLSGVSFVGKRRAMGMGEVEEWRVEEIPAFEWAREGRLLRPVPEGAADTIGIASVDSPSLVGWTCPQWKPSLFSQGWPVGASISP